jgi:hypothetical protein
MIWNDPISHFGESVAVHLAFVGISKIADQYLVSGVCATGASDFRWVLGDTLKRRASFDGTHSISRSGAAPTAALAEPAVGAVHISSTTEKYHAQPVAAVAAEKNVPFEKFPQNRFVDAQDTVKSLQIAAPACGAARRDQPAAMSYGESL